MSHELSSDDLKEKVLQIEKIYKDTIDLESARIFVRGVLSDVYYEGIQHGISRLSERLGTK